MSRLEPKNDLHLLLEAAAALRAGFAGLRVLIVGKGADADRLKGLVESLGLGEVVSFLGAIYEEERLAPLFCASSGSCAIDT